MASLSGLLPELQPYADLLVRNMPGAIVTSVYRSPTEQLELYRNRARNKYPVAPPGRSYHEYRRAFDVVADLAVLKWAGSVWRSWGGQWFASDPIHFQA